ncbi:hypothetical protein GCM10009103_48100 [Pseudomonas koreensis]|nr:hypothetical protein GCM10009103_48100 [Pseudomonas koreensis]
MTAMNHCAPFAKNSRREGLDKLRDVFPLIGVRAGNVDSDSRKGQLDYHV